MSQNIIPKDCSYGCNTLIYWNTFVNEYWEVPEWMREEVKGSFMLIKL